ncbi:hypothetical protein PHMEG_00041129 [Phytophthora megakarya]|uniref:Jacalin-type lectin domain-containing protein n=1 Tax=Phytophthora megakarya TaxID=4795 RepID=A0A225UC25_9STRA|nr:hypothetical protein PHMEG_00041129 [Phytophthora megakarya]
MKFFRQVLATAALVAASFVTAELEDGVKLGPNYGGPHGDKYSDLELVGPGQTVEAISIRSSDRVDAVLLDVTDASGQKSTLEHGGGGGDMETLTLGDGEYITGVQVHWGKYYRKTRVMYIEFTTNKKHHIKGGTPQDNTDKIGKDDAPEGYQLGGFDGFAGNELDSLAPIWTKIDPST